MQDLKQVKAQSAGYGGIEALKREIRRYRHAQVSRTCVRRILLNCGGSGLKVEEHPHGGFATGGFHWARLPPTLVREQSPALTALVLENGAEHETGDWL